MKVLIVDDEPLARENLRLLLQQHSDIDIAGEAANAIEGMAAINRLRPQVVFLDIQMPRITGLEMAGMLDPQHRPHIVFLTAFDEYALQAFDEAAFDYLLKPVEPARLTKCLMRLRQASDPQDLARLPGLQSALKYIPCNGQNRIYLLAMEDVACVSSRIGGVLVTSREGKQGVTGLTLRTLEQRTALLRCHRQHLINMDQLQEIRMGENGQGELKMKGGQTVPVSRRYLKRLKETLGL
ncbi:MULTISPECIES: two-component system response regulator BtsR [Tatumella]|uniref:Two-component system response regulator BtsR n=1 Tax=Tatumella punctata TaxID=399969 RepID=A0ABW1VSH6_9GAMM|nr:MULTISPECIES: two-component system response regulator BtsR [unclassified Tatumella]MBS0856728.1 two-component system response regulator BtsR [Tatumella sp. JGM16]MBS0877727.1 two-component system response regulator BtsR [Tatumella sp. JGM82]MBS0891484.1 two-component system response regulator BtsR [Tatumella sp. JGM94]MBS0894465.1 two-component system response regulator BtsR [Tatumella sp. JGM130]MBS0902362.1 two-component system response regulator BtsR [Tatumella sp. JGM100]